MIKIPYKELIKQYKSEGKAIAHFNISNLDQLRTICEVANELSQPVVIGVSEKERDYIGIKMTRVLINEMNKEYSIPIFLNADHTYTIDNVKTAVINHYDSIIIDGAKMEYEDNIKVVSEAVDYIKDYNNKNGTNILVEAELGYIGQSSSLNASLPEGVSEANITTIEQAKDFVDRTGIDLFAPAVGNIHGMLINAPNPRLHIDRIREISQAIPDTPLVLHGASGNTDEDIKDAIKSGISLIHINTEIRVAFRNGIKRYLDNNPLEIAPYKFEQAGQDEMRKVVRNKMELYIK
ncbi:MAG: class II fructose-bisphosphate aldolase [Cyanobium sp. MAG06]|nr:class II fructose-bisphosphate aldolase [Cyanobium sp. MAG06]